LILPPTQPDVDWYLHSDVSLGISDAFPRWMINIHPVPVRPADSGGCPV
jgi:hypothetical protein